VCALLSLVLASAIPFTARADESTDGEEQKRLDQEAPSLRVEERLPVDVPRIPAPGKKSYVQIDAALDTSFVAGSEYGDTKVTDTYSRLSFEVGAPLSRVVAIGAQARLGVRNFHFDGDGQFIDSGKSSGEPFDDLFEYSLSLGTRIRLIEGLDMEIAGRAISRVEEGARFASGLEGGGSVSLLGRYKKWIVLRLGVSLQSKFDDSNVSVSPVFRLRVRLHERVWAETGGRNGRLEFTVNDRVRVDLFGGVEGGRYRLEDRRDGPNGVGKGSIQIDRTDVGLATRVKLWKRLRILVEGGVVLTQTLEIKDSDGNDFDERETREPAFRGRVALKWRF